MLRAFLVTMLVMAACCASGCESKQPLRIGETAPPFSGTDQSGQTVSPDSLKGKTVLLYFWSNSCCGDRLRLAQPLAAKYRPEGLVLVAVDVGDSRDFVASYARDNGLDFPLLTDTGSNVAERYRIIGFPTIFLIDRNGIIREKIHGEVPVAKLDELVKRQIDRWKEAEAAYERLHGK